MNKYTWNIVAAIALLCLYGVQTNAQAKKDTLRILFVGNSYCLLYTSDAADDLLCVDLGGRRIIKKKIITI